MKTHMCKLVLTLLSANLISCGGNTSPNAESAMKVTKDASHPNVIVIVADQMRRPAMGFWSKPKYTGILNGVSDPVVTPTLDMLADQGLVFSQASSTYPLCSPFRAMLMSGMYPNHNGVGNNTRNDRPTVGLKTELTTLTEVFANAGYNTALVGKAHWQNNLPLFDKEGNYTGSTDPAIGGHFLTITDYDTYIPPGPARHGIEYWYQTIGHDHDNPLAYSNDPGAINGAEDGKPFHPKSYSSVVQADVIVDYIKNNRGQRDNTKPFSLLWTMDPPHNPYEEMTDTDEEIYNHYYKTPAIQDLLNRPNVDREQAEKFVRFYFSMVTLIDRDIGRVLDTLKQQGLEENTLIVFTADHGEMMGSHGLFSKNVAYEESLGIPLLMKYPNKVNHRISDLLIGAPDFMPTILGLAGLDQHIPKEVQGTDYADYIFHSNNTETVKPISSLYFGKASELGVRSDRYTYALNKKGELIALFNNIEDPYQQTLLALQDIPESDQHLLKTELGNWLAKIDHEWYHQQKHTSFVTYPE